MKNECPHCGANLIGGEIPQNVKHYYEGTHWNRSIGIVDQGEDRVVEWMCPDCRGSWK